MKVDFSDKAIGGFSYEFVRGVSTASAGAAELGECLETMGQIRDGDFGSWVGHWGALADRVAGYAERQFQAGDRLSARDAFLRASNYYRMAVFYAGPADERHRTLWERSKSCFQRMIPLLHHPIECVDVDFAGAKLPLYFVPGGDGPRPTLMALGGFDSTMEEVYGWVGTVAGQYGWHCAIFEGPGQWGALQRNPGLVFRPDYEKPVAAVVDYLLTRPDVDASKLALIGYSAGGYFAPRAAAGEPRIRACIANTLVVDCGEAARAGLKGMTNPWLIDTAFGLIMKFSTAARWGFQHAQWSLGIEHPHQWPDAYAPFTLKGLEGSFQSPMLFLFSEDDVQDAAASTPRIVVGLLEFILSLSCERAIHLFTREQGASSHCQMGGLTYAHAVIFAWLNDVLGGQPMASCADPRERARVVDVFRRYGGAEGGAKAQALLDAARLV
jgi:hypothetical protein